MKEKKEIVISTSGKLGSGKDEFMKIIAETIKTPVELHSWADGVREITELLTGYQMTVVYPAGKPFFNEVRTYTQDQKNHYLKEWGITIGRMLQLVGTECMREGLNQDTWLIKLFGTRGKECFEADHILAIPDTRFPNEADLVLEKDGYIFRMEGDPMDIRKNSKRDLNHISETALDDYEKFTEIVDNSVPDLEVFKSKIINIAEKYQIF